MTSSNIFLLCFSSLSDIQIHISHILEFLNTLFFNFLFFSPLYYNLRSFYWHIFKFSDSCSNHACSSDEPIKGIFCLHCTAIVFKKEFILSYNVCFSAYNTHLFHIIYFSIILLNKLLIVMLNFLLDKSKIFVTWVLFWCLLCLSRNFSCCFSYLVICC